MTSPSPGPAATSLDRIPIFQSLDDEQLHAVAALLRPRSMAEGEVIVREGEEGDAFFIIREGAVRVVSDEAERAVTLARLGTGEFFGELALLRGGLRSATVTAERQTELWELTRGELQELGAAHPEILRQIEQVAAQREASDPGRAFEHEAESLFALSARITTVTLGRAESNDIVLDDPTVSAFHAEIRPDGDGFLLRDNGSATGTHRNRIRIREAPLEDGDVLQLGAVRLFVRDGVIKRYVSSRGVRIEAIGISRTVAGDRTILQPTDLAVAPGELVAIVGSSGAGKTTLLQTLLGLYPPSTGDVYYESTSLTANLDLYRSTLGNVPQDDIIHPELTVEQTLHYASRLRLPPDLSAEEIERRIDRVLEQVGLEAERSNTVHNLSGGQRKRASIAAELLAEPRAFFLDEPTSGLDPGLDEQIMNLLREMANEGRTVVLTTHATRNIHVCDRIVVLTGGRVVFVGPPSEALSYFGADDFVEIYRTLEAERSTALAERYEHSETYQRNVAARLITETQAVDSARPAAAPTSVSSDARRFLHQTRVLVGRNFRLMYADRGTLLLRLLGAPIIAIGLLLSFDPDIFAIATHEGGNVLSASSLLHIASAVAIFLSATGAATEITRERSIYQRERLVNLSPYSYVASKVIALVGLSVLQSLALVGIIALGISLTPPAGETFALLFAAMFMTSLAGMAMGLFISSVSSNPDQAITTAVILLIPQLIFAGAIVPLSEMQAVARVVADFMMSKWSLELLGSISDLEPRVIDQAKIITLAGPLELDHPFRHAYGHPTVWRWLVLAGFSLTFIFATTFVQLRKGRS